MYRSSGFIVKTSNNLNRRWGGEFGMSVIYPEPFVLYILAPHSTIHVQPHREPMDSFFYLELERALGEQSFGITAFQLVGPTTSLEASAYVTLLEGNIVHISLSARGYQVCNFFAPCSYRFLILERIGVHQRLLKTPAIQRLLIQEGYSRTLKNSCQHSAGDTNKEGVMHYLLN